MLILAVLSLLALAAALGWVVRYRASGRAEQVVVVSLFWNFLVLVPIYTLGFLGKLTPGALGGLSLVLFGGAFAASFAKTDGRAHGRRVLATAWGLARLPWDVVRVPFAQRSLTFLFSLLVVFLLVWTGLLSYLVSSDAWDGIAYHEPMIGFALQNHGFAPIDLSSNWQAVNGFPRNSEMTSLWFVVFSDRRLLEVVQTVMSPLFLAAGYLLAHRLTKDTSTALLWSFAVFLMPGTVLQLRSSYIDLHTAAFTLAVMHLCTRPTMRMRDGVVASVALALLLGTKYMSMASVPLFALVGLGRLAAAHFRARRKDVLLTALAGVGIVLLGAAKSFQNWVVFKSLIYPFPMPSFLTFAAKGGGGEAATGGADAASRLARFDLNKPLDLVFNEGTAPFVAGKNFADERVWGYGGPLLVIVPLGAVGLVMLLTWGVSALTRKALRKPSEPLDGASLNLLLILVPTAITAVLSPAIWSARYNIHIAFGAMLAVVWLGALWRSLRYQEALAFFMAGLNALYLYWAVPGFGVSWARAQQLMSMTVAQRVGQTAMDWPMPYDVAQLREKETGPNAAVGFSDGVEFLGDLWNDHYSNRVVYLPPEAPDAMLARAKAEHIVWVVTSNGGPLHDAVTRHPDEWRRIGSASRKFSDSVFRYVGPKS